MADPQIPISDWVIKIKEAISSTEIIDMALIIIKSTDYRIDLAQIACMRAMKKFLDGLEPANTFIVFTHCDKKLPDINFQQKKLASLKKFGNLEIPQANIILFDNTAESLEGFVETMIHGKITVVEDIEEAVQQLDEGMCQIARNVDNSQETNLSYQLELMKELYSELLRDRPQQLVKVVYCPEEKQYFSGEEDTQDQSFVSASGAKRSVGRPRKVKSEEDKQNEAALQKAFAGYKGPRTKAGLPDARTKEGKQAIAAYNSGQKVIETQQAVYVKSANLATGVKVDKRTKAYKDSLKEEQKSVPSTASKAVVNNPMISGVIPGPKKSNGELDMRYKQNKDRESNNPSSIGAASKSTTSNNITTPTGPTKPDGGLDMRYTVNKQHAAAQQMNTSTASVKITPVVTSSSSGYSGKCKADGTPDMRCAAAKAYVSS